MQDDKDQNDRGYFGDHIPHESAGISHLFRDLEEQCDDWVREVRLAQQTQEHPFRILSTMKSTHRGGSADPPVAGWSLPQSAQGID